MKYINSVLGFLVALALLATACTSGSTDVAESVTPTAVEAPTEVPTEAPDEPTPTEVPTEVPLPEPTAVPEPTPTPEPAPPSDGCAAGAAGEVTFQPSWVDGTERLYEIEVNDLTGRSADVQASTLASLRVSEQGGRLTWAESGRLIDVIALAPTADQVLGDAAFNEASIAVEYGPLGDWIWSPPSAPLNNAAVADEWMSVFEAVVAERSLDAEDFFVRNFGRRFEVAGVTVLNKAPRVLHLLEGEQFTTDPTVVADILQNPLGRTPPAFTADTTLTLDADTDDTGCAVLTTSTVLTQATAVDEMVELILAFIGVSRDEADMGNVTESARLMSLERTVVARLDTSSGFLRSIEVRTTFDAGDFPWNRDRLVVITDVTPGS